MLQKSTFVNWTIICNFTKPIIGVVFNLERKEQKTTLKFTLCLLFCLLTKLNWNITEDQEVIWFETKFVNYLYLLSKIDFVFENDFGIGSPKQKLKTFARKQNKTILAQSNKKSDFKIETISWSCLSDKTDCFVVLPINFQYFKICITFLGKFDNECEERVEYSFNVLCSM